MLTESLDLTYRAWNKLLPTKIFKVYEINRDNLPEHPPVLPSSYEPRLIQPEELYDYTQDPVYQLNEDFLEHAIRRGDECFGISHRGKLLSYGWYTQLPTPMEYGLAVSPPARSFYTYKGFTHPDARGLQLHSYAKYHAILKLSTQESKHFYSYVEMNNYPAIRSYEKLGGKMLGLVSVMQSPSKSWIFHSTEVKKTGFTIHSPGLNLPFLSD